MVWRRADGHVRLSEWLRRLSDESLLRNGLYIMGVTVVNSGLGFVFWIVAAHDLPTAQVGRAAALLSAMFVVSVLTILGIDQLLISRLPSRAAGHEWSLTVTTGLTLSAAVSVAGGVIAVAVLPALVPALEHGVGVLAFVLLPLGVAGAATSLVIDHACVAERHAKPTLWRNGAMATTRLMLIAAAPVVPFDGTTWILMSWTGAFLLFDAWGISRVLPRLRPGFRPTLRGWRQEVMATRGLLAGHQAINIGSQGSQFVLPVVVSARLGPTDGAYFYTTFMAANGVYFIAPAISSALFAESAYRPGNLDRDVRRACRHIVLLAAPVAAVLFFGARLILDLFGARYGAAGSDLLRALVLVAAFDAGGFVVTAVLRARHQLRDAAVATFAALVLAVISVWVLLPTMGLVGAGVGWGVGKAAGLIVGLLFVAFGRRPVHCAAGPEEAPS